MGQNLLLFVGYLYELKRTLGKQVAETKVENANRYCTLGRLELIGTRS